MERRLGNLNAREDELTALLIKQRQEIEAAFWSSVHTLGLRKPHIKEAAFLEKNIKVGDDLYIEVPDSMPETKTAIIQYLHSQGMDTKTIASKMGVAYQQAYQAIKKMSASPAPVNKKKYYDAVDKQGSQYDALGDSMMPIKASVAETGWQAARDLLGVTCKLPEQKMMGEAQILKTKADWVTSWVGTSTSPEVAVVLGALNTTLGHEAKDSMASHVARYYDQWESRELYNTAKLDKYSEFGHQYLFSDHFNNQIARWNAKHRAKTVLYRGINGEEQKLILSSEVGDMVSLKSIVSTSSNAQRARQFGPVLLRFKNLPGTHVFSSREFDDERPWFKRHAGEMETMVMGNMTPWKIVSIETNEFGQKVYDLEPLPFDVAKDLHKFSKKTTGTYKEILLTKDEMEKAKKMYVTQPVNTIAATLQKPVKAVYDAIHFGVHDDGTGHADAEGLAAKKKAEEEEKAKKVAEEHELAMWSAKTKAKDYLTPADPVAAGSPKNLYKFAINQLSKVFNKTGQMAKTDVNYEAAADFYGLFTASQVKSIVFHLTGLSSTAYDEKVQWLIKELFPEIKESLREALDTNLDPIHTSLCGPVPTFTLHALKGQSKDFAFMTYQNERDALRGIIAAAEESGWTRKQTSAVIQHVFNEGFHQVDKKTGKVVKRFPTESWARMVARTELCRASSMGEMAMYDLAGVEELEWSASEGTNMCPTCGMADGEVVKRGEDFPFVDVDMPPAHPACQCMVIPSDEDLVSKRSDPENIAWAARGGRTAEEYKAQFGFDHPIDVNPPARYGGKTP